MPCLPILQGLFAEIKQTTVISFGFFFQLFGSAHNTYLLQIRIIVEHIAHPASAREHTVEQGRLHIGVMVEEHQRKRIMNLIGPQASDDSRPNQSDECLRAGREPASHADVPLLPHHNNIPFR